MFDTPSTPQLPVPPAAAAPPPMFGAAPQGKKPKQQSMQPTFLGEGAKPLQGQLGQKTLMGQ